MYRERSALESELLKLGGYKYGLESRIEELQQDESDHQLRMERMDEEVKLRQRCACTGYVADLRTARS